MKIIYTIAGFYRPAGMERILCDKANYLAARGYELLIVTTEQKGRPDVFPLEEGIRREDLGIGYEDDNGASFFTKLVHHPGKKRRHEKKLKELLIREKADIVVSMFCGDETFLPAIKDGSKKVLEVHFSRFKRLQYGRKGFWAAADRFRSKREGRAAGRFDRFVALTGEDLGYWGNPGRGVAIPNFISEMPSGPSPLSEKVVLAVGRFTFQKAFDRLIDIWAEVCRRLPDDNGWKLRLVGGGEDLDKMQEQVRRLSLEDSVVFTSFSDDMPAIYRGASVFALTSRYEGLPMVLLEAQAYGLPAVAYDCKCGPKDVICDGRNGFLVGEGDGETFAQRLLQLIENDTLRREMGAASREDASRWDKDKIMGQWIELFRNI